VIVEFIDAHQGHRAEPGGLRWGVEPICRVLSEHGLRIAPSTYYDHLDKPPTARQQRDRQLKLDIARVHAANYGVYGARKVWLTLNRERPAGAAPIARYTVEPLMGELGLAGAVRGKVKRTTIANPAAVKPADLVDRRFTPLAPDRLWVADFTYVSTWSGWCYTAFVIDAYARRILGWSVATTMTTQLVLDAVDQAIWTRHPKAETWPGWLPTTITAVSTCPSPTPNASRPLVSSPRPVRWAPPTTTPWPSP
jgi:putative transposase